MTRHRLYVFSAMLFAGLPALRGQASSDSKAKPAKQQSADTQAKTRSKPSTGSFAARVDEFWSWFEKRSDAIADLFDGKVEGDPRELVGEISPKLEAVIPNVSWQFGPGSKKGKHALMLSPSGDLLHYMLAREWRRRAPAMGRWDAYSAKQASSVEGVKIRLDRTRELDFDGVRVVAKPDAKRKLVDLTVFHAQFARLAERQRRQLSFLVLDELFGEAFVTAWIGRIDTSKKAAPDAALSLKALRDWVRTEFARRKWKASEAPDMRWSVLAGKPPKKERYALREDIVTISTRLPEVSGRPVGSSKIPKVPGLYLAFVRIGGGVDDQPETVFDTRTQLGKKVAKALGEHGVHFGGAIGKKAVYLDLAFFDAKAGIAALRKAFAKAKARPAITLHAFLPKPGEKATLLTPAK